MSSHIICEKVVTAALEAAQMIAREGVGENQRAHGFLFIIGNSTELLAPDPVLKFPQTESSVHSKYGFFPKDLDRREAAILIKNCCEDDAQKRALQTLCARDNAIIIDGTSGQVCCGGFANRDSTTPYGTGSRTRAASSIAVNADCVSIKASEDICCTRQNPISDASDAHFEVFRRDYYPTKVPVRVPVRESPPSTNRTFMVSATGGVHGIKYRYEGHAKDKDSGIEHGTPRRWKSPAGAKEHAAQELAEKLQRDGIIKGPIDFKNINIIDGGHNIP